MNYLNKCFIFSFFFFVRQKIIFLQLTGLEIIFAAPSYFQSPYTITSPTPYLQISDVKQIAATAANYQNTLGSAYKIMNNNVNGNERSGSSRDNNNGNTKLKKAAPSYVKGLSSTPDPTNFLFAPESDKRMQTYPSEYLNAIDDFPPPSISSPGIVAFPYTGNPTKLLPVNAGRSQDKSYPPTASSKIFIPDHHHSHHHGGPPDFDHFLHHEKPHFLYENVDLLTGVAGHKLKHAGEVLESGALTEPIVHKLPFIKAALLQLLAIIGPLSAAKTIHVIAQGSHSSNPHHDHHEPAALPSAPSGPGEPMPLEPYHAGPPHHPPTLVGLILNFMGQLSRFNTEAKVHLIPNLLKILSTSSTSSAHSSAHY